jgi:Putative porin
MILNNKYALALAGLVALTASAAFADDQALIDALVRKGILSQKDAEQVESEVSKNPSLVAPPSSPLKLAPWIKELKLGGNLLLRYQWDEEQAQEPSSAPGIPTPTPSPSLRNPTPTLTASPNGRNHVATRSRWRFKLFLNADVKFDAGFFGRFSLTTTNFSDTNFQTYTGGFQNYSIYIREAFLGWNGYPGLTVIAGKQDLPFYATTLFWDQIKMFPQGLVERIDFDQLFGWNSGGEPVSYRKDGKAPPSAPAKHYGAFELALIAGQFIFYDNNEYNFDSDLKNDSYFFEEQLLARYKTDWFSITLAPSLFIANAAGYGHDTVANGPAGNFSSVNTGGFTAPAKSTSFLQFLDGTGEERDLFVVQAPGDITVKVGKIPVKFYWDFAYNFDGGKRFSLLGTAGQRMTTGTLFNGTSLNAGSLVITQRDGTNPTTFPFAGLYSEVVTDSHGNVIAYKNLAQPSDKDKMAWLLGLQVGDNKKAGDLSAYVDYRQIGIAAVDPNLSFDDAMIGRLNFRGFGFGIAYNVTDFLILGVSGRIDWNLTNLYGGQATRGSGIADDNSWHYVRAEALLSF